MQSRRFVSQISWTVKVTALVAGALALMSCQTPSVNKDEATRSIATFTVANSINATSVGCKSMVDTYCSHLYSPEASGNLIIEREKPIQILQGETPNQLSHVFLKYSQAKIRNRSRLPADFHERLDQYGYFDKLADFIHRSPIPKMSLTERLFSERLESELNSLWQVALDQTVVARMSHKYHGYYQIPDTAMPIEYDIERKRMRRTLISNISKAVWREDANWKKVERGFEDLKESFYSLFDRLDITPELKKAWTEKIATVELVLPGSIPEIADDECSKTTNNAFYYKYLNLITVCAGDFNSEDIILTLAHEMSHALDVERGMYSFLMNSPLGRQLTHLRREICEDPSRGNPLNCEDWKGFKEWLPNSQKEIADYKADLPEFNRCLKKLQGSRPMSEVDSRRISQTIASNRVSNLAEANVFLRLVKDNVPMRNGKMQANPSFLNPCGYYLWSKNNEPIDDELFTLVFFTAEYQCAAGDQGERLKTAIETAKSMSAQVIQMVIDREGEFSDRWELISEGFASPPAERFADVIGSYAMAEYLKKYSLEGDRRAKYLASSSWLCREPSLETKFPKESLIEQQFNQEVHSVLEERKLQMLSEPVREILQCNKDFTVNECSLPFRK